MVRRRVRLIGLAVGIVVGFLLTGCSLLGYQDELGRSLETWQRLKAEHDGYYRYETSFGSWTGFGHRTTLTVRDEVVVARAYEAYAQDDNTGETTITESWTEEGSEVGSHDMGADPVTVEALYDSCRSDVLTKNTLENDIYLEFREDGVLRYCQYAPKNCVDDCSTGVNISDLEFLKD